VKKHFIIASILVLSILCTGAVAEQPSSPKRIISLAPNVTEILFALGLGENIVGVTTFCDYPEEAKKKHKIGGMSNPSLEAVISLKPDLVVVTTDGNPKEFEERLVSMKINTYIFDARRLSELPQGIRGLAAALGVKDRGELLAREIEEGTRKAGSGRRKAMDSTIRNLQSEIRNKVLFIVWPEPLIVAGPGTVIDDAITLLGYQNIAGAAKTAYPKYSLEDVMYQAPEILVIGKGSGMDMHAVSRGILQRMKSVPAVKSGSICYLGDGLYRLGPRVVKGIEELAACLK
jgi:iron complex transport system substrate-binding protein